LRTWALAIVLAIGVVPGTAAAASPVDTTAAIVAGAVSAVDASYSIAGDIVPASMRPRFEADLARMKTYAREREAESSFGLLDVARARGRDRLIGADVTEKGSLAESMRFLASVQFELHDSIATRVSRDSARGIEHAMDRLRDIQRGAVFDRLQDRLQHFAIKYGPGSPRLNAVEAAANFFVFQRLPGFKPGSNGVSPLEFVSGYSTSYGTVANDAATAMSVVEVGVRIYNWGFDPSPESVPSALKPRYWALGLAASSEKDGALRVPWEKNRDTRYGPFASWGDFKVAYLLGEDDDWRVMVSRQLQLIPHLF